MKANEVIKLKRKEKGMTLRELAEKVGVSEGTVSRWESGDIRSMKHPNIEALSKVLGISPAILMEWEEYEEAGSEQYYLDPESKEMAEFLAKNRDYKGHKKRGRPLSLPLCKTPPMVRGNAHI